METKELRIADQKGFKGSYVLHKGEVKNVFALYQPSQVVIWLNDEIGMNPVDVSELNPIPLTEEWLIKFGFEKKKEDILTYFDIEIEGQIIKIDTLESTVELYGADSVTSGQTFCIYNINYVHQLQNLYFVLTGKELELK